MNKLKLSRTTLMFVSFVVLSLSFSEAAMADDIFDRLSAITGKMPIVKNFLIWAFFLGGIYAVGSAGYAMWEKSKPDSRSDTQWSHIGIRFVAGVVLVMVTSSTDLISNTLFNKSATTSSPNSGLIQ